MKMSKGMAKLKALMMEGKATPSDPLSKFDKKQSKAKAKKKGKK